MLPIFLQIIKFQYILCESQSKRKGRYFWWENWIFYNIPYDTNEKSRIYASHLHKL